MLPDTDLKFVPLKLVDAHLAAGWEIVEDTLKNPRGWAVLMRKVA